MIRSSPTTGNVQRLTLLLIVVVASMLGLTTAKADAAIGTYYRGEISCTPNYDGFNSLIRGFSPIVRAANTTAAVDHQWVYWTARVVEERVALTGARSYVGITEWSAWGYVYAADNTWSAYMTDEPTGATFNNRYWSLFSQGGLGSRFVQNEVWFYDNAGWHAGGVFLSAPGHGSGSVNGNGYCS